MILLMGSLTTGTVNLSGPREELSAPASRLDIVWAKATLATSIAVFVSFFLSALSVLSPVLLCPLLLGLRALPLHPPSHLLFGDDPPRSP